MLTCSYSLLFRKRYEGKSIDFFEKRTHQFMRVPGVSQNKYHSSCSRRIESSVKHDKRALFSEYASFRKLKACSVKTIGRSSYLFILMDNTCNLHSLEINLRKGKNFAFTKNNNIQKREKERKRIAGL